MPGLGGCEGGGMKWRGEVEGAETKAGSPFNSLKS